MSSHQRSAVRGWGIPCCIGFFVLGAVMIASSPGKTQGLGRGMRGPSSTPAAMQPRAPTRRRTQAALPQFRKQGSGKRIVDVRIVVVGGVKEEEVRKQIRTRKDREFDSDILEEDYRRLAGTGLFRKVEPLIKEVSGGVVVTFRVHSRPIMRYVRYVHNRELVDKVLAKQAGIKKGDPLNPFVVEEAARKLEEHYHEKGYVHATIRIAEGSKRGDNGVVFVIDEGPYVKIRSVRFVGNDPAIATAGRLMTQIKSKPRYIPTVLSEVFAGELNRRRVDEDTQRLTAYYRNLGFFRARVGRIVRMSSDKQWAHITFVVNQGPRYKIRNVTVMGNKTFDPNSIVKGLKLQQGNFVDVRDMQRDVNTLSELYGQYGYVFCDVKAESRFLIDYPGQIDMIYRVEEGAQYRVGDIDVQIAGEYPHTRQKVILNRLSLIPGQIIDIREVRSSERRLRRSKLFVDELARGVSPRIKIRPPELKDLETFQRNARTVRGQSPNRNGQRR